jgi:hypothetical protein
MIFTTGARPPGDEVEALAATVSGVCPGFVPSGVLHRSATSVLLAGAVWGDPVVAKLLVSDSPFWRETFAREIDVYRFFDRHHPPFLVPRLVVADDRHPLLVLEHLTGTPIARGRYPAEEIPPRRLAAVLTALRRVNDWHAPIGVLPRILDYRNRLERYRRGGQLNEKEHAQLLALLGAVGDAAQFCHGNLMMSHVLRRQDDYKEGDYAIVDWAFASVFLPGFDLARMWTLLRATFGVRSEIEDSVRGRSQQEWNAFLVNLAVVLAQELRTHREQPSSPERDERLAGLEQDWLTVRDRLRLAVAAI